MKESLYNYYVPYKDTVALFNGITEKYILLPQDRVKIYKTIIGNPSAYVGKLDNFLHRLEENGFIVDDRIDEFESVKNKYEILRQPNQYYLMILPTYQCNLRCWYCTQHHQDMEITHQIIKRIKESVRHKLSSSDIKHFHLSWFGGEPILSFDILLDFTKFAKKLTKSLGIAFTSAITTNATLLTESKIEELKDVGVSHYQITIDGEPRTHDAIKALSNASAFENTMKNINLIAQHTSVTLRFNYTHKNLKPKEIIASINSYLSQKAKENIQLHLIKVWQEDQNKIPESKIEELIELAQASGLKVNTIHNGMCYVDQIHFDCIFPNGKVGKCDNDNPDDVSGIIGNNGDILYPHESTSDYNINLLENKLASCYNCRYIPICWGPCMAKKTSDLKKYSKIVCQYEDKEKEMEAHIRNIIESKN